ncbi:MAG: hypothetical protein IJV16_01445 [Lachnospiraceae bacterium]|nr:hypothetical protein [Lachnospiraceae bacterium]MBR1524295.1 hypothetical protein [Lachnospiraceae bacterium]
MRNSDGNGGKDGLKKGLMLCAGFFAGCALGYLVGFVGGDERLYTAFGGVIGLALVADIVFAGKK